MAPKKQNKVPFSEKDATALLQRHLYISFFHSSIFHPFFSSVYNVVFSSEQCVNFFCDIYMYQVRRRHGFDVASGIGELSALEIRLERVGCENLNRNHRCQRVSDAVATFSIWTLLP